MGLKDPGPQGRWGPWEGPWGGPWGAHGFVGLFTCFVSFADFVKVSQLSARIQDLLAVNLWTRDVPIIDMDSTSVGRMDPRFGAVGEPGPGTPEGKNS